MEGSMTASRFENILWVVGVLVCATTCFAYMREAASDNDSTLVKVTGVAGAGFIVAAIVYAWWVW
jgi:hypothetical protein